MSNSISVGETRNILDPNSMTFEERERDLEAQARAKEKALQREKNSPFSNWAQLNLIHSKELRSLAMKNPIAHGILYFLVEQMDNYNAVMCSYQVLQDVLEISSATVARNIKTLKEKGFIAVLKSGTSNVYTVNHDVFWKSWGNKKQYSKFPANVILSATEQEQAVQLKIEKFKAVEVDTAEQD